MACLKLSGEKCIIRTVLRKKYIGGSRKCREEGEYLENLEIYVGVRTKGKNVLVKFRSDNIIEIVNDLYLEFGKDSHVAERQKSIRIGKIYDLESLVRKLKIVQLICARNGLNRSFYAPSEIRWSDMWHGRYGNVDVAECKFVPYCITIIKRGDYGDKYSPSGWEICLKSLFEKGACDSHSAMTIRCWECAELNNKRISQIA